MTEEYHIVDIIDSDLHNYGPILYKKNYSRDYFIVDCVWHDVGENTFIKIINNPLGLDKYSAFIKFIKIKDNCVNSSIAYNMLYKNLYYVNINVDGVINNCIYIANNTGVRIPNNSVLRIKMYFQGSNKFLDIIDEINNLELSRDYQVIPLSMIKSVKENDCKLM